MSKTEALTISVKEAAELSGFGRDAIYNLCHVDGFPVIRCGKRGFRIHREKFIQWVSEMAEKNAG